MLFALFSEPVLFVLWTLAVVYGITIHEFAHVAAAYAMGDTTGRDLGRLTLNPMVHVDLVGFLMLLLIGFGWGNPAPYNPYKLRYPKWGPALVAMAGPFSNLVSIAVFGLIFRFLSASALVPANSLIFEFLVLLMLVNLVLMLFNLLPIPPLDGSRLLFTILPDRWAQFKQNLAQNGPFILIGLLLIDSLIPGASIFGSIFNWGWNILSRLFV